MFSALSKVIERRRMELQDEKTGPGEGSEAPKVLLKQPSYTRELLLDRNIRLKKIGEEAAELIAACADGYVARATEEAADLIYHIGVALAAVGGSLDAVATVLFERSQEKA